MSRIGIQPVVIPSGVKFTLKGGEVKIKGSKGELSRTFPEVVQIQQEGDAITVDRVSDEPWARAMHGTTRALIQNMVTGVSEGWSKTLQVQGVGYRAEMQGNKLILNLGFSHPIEVTPPENIEFEVDQRAGTIVVRGIDKEQVGQVASEIRAWRPPEPYKGKGIRYQGEYVRRKAGKAGKVG